MKRTKAIKKNCKENVKNEEEAKKKHWGGGDVAKCVQFELPTALRLPE
jgi:hypothetical protein